MNIYLAARYSRRAEMCQYAWVLQAAGHMVTSRWVFGAHERHDGVFDASDDEEHRRLGAEYAHEDIEDINAAQVLIAFTESPGNNTGRGRGGRHVELGYALARGLHIIICGHWENVFCCLPQIMHYPTWNELARPGGWLAASQEVGA